MLLFSDVRSDVRKEPCETHVGRSSESGASSPDCGVAIHVTNQVRVAAEMIRQLDTEGDKSCWYNLV